MQRIIRFSIFILLVLFLSSMNGAQLSSSLYLSEHNKNNVFYQAKVETKVQSVSKVLGAYVENQTTSVVNPYQVYSYDQMLKDAEKLQKLYPDIIKTQSLGTSSGGRTILLVKLGIGNKKITLNGSHHAREYISSTLLMKMIDEYAYSYKNNVPFKGFNVRQILNEVTIYFVPMVNPDGVTLVQFGADRLSNPQEVKKINDGKKSYKSWKANGKGIDLNYQYPFGWEQIRKLNGPSSEGFKGFSPATEIEAKVMMKLTMENPFLIHAAYHTQGEIIYWYNGQENDFYNQCLKIGKKLSELTGYRLLSKSDQKRSFGGYKDWTVTTFKKPGYTIELCPYVGNFPYPDKWFNNVWNKAGASALLFAKEAMEMEGYDYQVYNQGVLHQVFNNKPDAVAFAKQYGATEVKIQEKILWQK